MKKRQVFSSMNYDHTKVRGQVFTKPSMTVPDGTMSVREIFNRYARGSALPLGKDVFYDPEDDTPDIRTLDLAEIEQYKGYAETEIKNIREQKNKQNDKKTKDVSGEQSSKNDGEGDNK